MEKIPTATAGTWTPNPNFIYDASSNKELKSNKMKQVKAALFTVTRDPRTNEIIDSEFVKEFWVKQKPGVSFDVAASHANGYAINPDTEVIREILTVSFY